MSTCEDCPLSLSCWSGALLGKEESRVAYPKDVKDRAVWQESVTLCPVCEQLCVITYKWGEVVETLDEGLHVNRPYGKTLMQPGDVFTYRGVRVVRSDGRGRYTSLKGLHNDTSDPLDGQDFTLERHRCGERTQTTQGWMVWYSGFIKEGPLFVVREDDTAPSAHPGDVIWVKICPECLKLYLSKAAQDPVWNRECLYTGPNKLIGTSDVTKQKWKEHMLNTKADSIPGWSDNRLHRTFWPFGCTYPVSSE